MTDTTRPELLQQAKTFLASAIQERGQPPPGDQQDWEEFFDLYNGILTRFAGKLGFRPGEIDDLLQEVWTDVVRLLPTFEYDPAKGGFRRWLYRIMRSKAADIGRRRRRLAREKALPESPSGGWEALPDAGGEDPAVAVERKFLVEIVQLATERFRATAAPKDWQVFERCKLGGQASSVVGPELGLTAAATRKRLQRSLGQFRQILIHLIGGVEPEDDWF
jgi:RNA polymerase sigma-70 factor (ECF subfamily)